MLMTVLEARVPREHHGKVEQVFRQGMADLPPGLVETYLVRDLKDESLFRLTTIWRSQEDLDRMRASGKPRGVVMFETVGAHPELTIFEVITHRSQSAL